MATHPFPPLAASVAQPAAASATSDIGSEPGAEAARLDGALAASMEGFARLAATALRAPASVVVLVGTDRRCFGGGPAVPSWLAHDPGALYRSGLIERVARSATPVTCVDARDDDDPAVRAAATELGFAGFAAAALRGADDALLGAFCVLDVRPTVWTDEELAILGGLASAASVELDLRRALAERESVERELRHRAHHDGLTGLLNRAGFVRRLEEALARERLGPRDADAGEELVAVLFMDLDGFKAVNDRIGHHAGDLLLAAVARRLASTIGAEDAAARLGGDEFAVLLAHVGDPGEAMRHADRIRTALTTPFRVAGYEVTVGASVGVALSACVPDLPEHLLRNADLAMARAKQATSARDRALPHQSEGAARPRPQLFDWKMPAAGLARLRLERDLRRAVREEEFALDFQPVVSLARGRVVGAEALVRWHHPERGLLPPGDFVRAAEDSGIILALGRWILREACRRAAEWNVPGGIGGIVPLSVAVNLSPRQFAQPDFVEQVARALCDAGCDPACLVLEITESAVLDGETPAVETLTALRHLGVRVHLDDFGAGMSSLSHLHLLPLDAVKVDHGVVGRMDDDERARRTVRSVVGLAQEAGLSVVAEGVTSAGQLRLLREFGCAYAQGRFFAPPLDSTALAALIASSPSW